MSYRRVVTQLSTFGLLFSQVACSSSSGSPSPSANLDSGDDSVSAQGDETDEDAGAGDTDSSESVDSESVDPGSVDSSRNTNGGSVLDAARLNDAKSEATVSDASGVVDATSDSSRADAAEGGAHDAGAVEGAAADSGQFAKGLSLTALTVNQSGREGADLAITIAGSDTNETSFALDVSLLDATGAPVFAFTDWKGEPTESERIVLFDNASAVGKKAIASVVTLPGFASAFPNLVTVVGALVNSLGESAPLDAAVNRQIVKPLGNSCDSHLLLDRCASGLSCTGTPSTCTAAAAPQISQFVYQRFAQGPMMRMIGTDPADDISTIHFEFLNAAGASVDVDMDGNGDMANSFDVSLKGKSVAGSFEWVNQALQGFDTSVQQLAATPVGTATGSGKRVTAMIGNPTLGATGHTCDLLGFNGCVANDVCVAQSSPATTMTCQVLTTARTTAAAAAPVLNPASNKLATGYTQPTDLWGDPPVGCVPTAISGMPESAVLLHLAASAPSLTITAGNPETNFPLALFVLPKTGAAVGTTVLGCNSSSPATLTLSNLAAGDYTIVVESRSATGGEYGVSIE